jgi:transposase
MTGTRPERLVFVDESGATIRLTPLMGRAPRGQRCLGQVPRNWGQTTTLLAAMTWDGITAALLVEGATDQPVFDTFVTDVLAPQLVPGQIVVWDNLSVHKSPRARQAIVARGCELRFLPPYSPDFNPIEQAFSKLKARLRRAQARTQSSLWDAIGDGLRAITAADARGWFRHCGYASAGQYL